jgi:hypothetical protein
MTRSYNNDYKISGKNKSTLRAIAPRIVRIPFAPKISFFVLKLSMRKNNGGATKVVIGKVVIGKADYLALLRCVSL